MANKVREELWVTFFHEVEELLETLEQQLLDLEGDLTNSDLIAGLFRTMHTFKGSSGMMGLTNVEHLAHRAEDIMDLVRDNKLVLNVEILDLMFEALDSFKDAKDIIREHKSDDTLEVPKKLLANLEAQAKGSNHASEEAKSVDEGQDSKHDPALWQQLIQECSDQLDTVESLLLQLENNHQDAELIDALFRVLHSLKGSFNLAGLTQATNLLHYSEDMIGLIRDQGVPYDALVSDTLLAAVDLVRKGFSEFSNSKQDLDKDSSENLISKLKELFTTLCPKDCKPSHNSVDEPSSVMVQSELQIDAEFLDIFFDIVWSNLNHLKKFLKESEGQSLKKEVKKEIVGLLDDINHAASQLGQNIVSDAISQFLTFIEDVDVSIDILGNQCQNLYHFFWDLEDELQSKATSSVASMVVAHSALGHVDAQTEVSQLVEIKVSDWFDELWPILTKLRKELEELVQVCGNKKSQVKNVGPSTYEAINALKILVAGIDKIKVESFLKPVIDQFENSSLDLAALSEGISDLYNYFWDLEDQLGSEKIETLTKKQNEEQDKIEKQSNNTDESEVKIVPISSDLSQEEMQEVDSIESIGSEEDPLFVYDYLCKIREDLSRYQLLKIKWAQNDQSVLADLQKLLEGMRFSSENMGYNTVETIIDDFLKECVVNNWSYQNDEVKVFEPALFKALSDIEQCLPESIQEHDVTQPNIGHIFRQWHATQCFHTIDSLNHALQSVIENYQDWQSGKSHVTKLQEEVVKCLSYTESLFLTCQYYGFEKTEQYFLHINDYLFRGQYDANHLQLEVITSIINLVQSLGASVHQFIEYGKKDEANLENCYQSIQAALGHSVDNGFLKLAKQFVSEIKLPDCISEHLNDDMLSDIGKNLHVGKNLFLLFMDVEHDDSLSEKAFIFLQSSEQSTLFSFTDYLEERSVFYFIIVTDKTDQYLEDKLQEIDSERKYLRLEHFEPVQKNTLAHDDWLVKESQSASIPEGWQTDSNGLQNAMGELIAIKSNLSQLTDHISQFDLLECVDKAMNKCQGDWLKAKHIVLESLSEYDSEVKNLVQAQVDVSNVLEKLQGSVRTLRELPMECVFQPFSQWYSELKFERSVYPKLVMVDSDLSVERDCLKYIELPLKQMLYSISHHAQPIKSGDMLMKMGVCEREQEQVLQIVLHNMTCDVGEMLDSRAVFDDVKGMLFDEKTGPLFAKGSFSGIDFYKVRKELEEQNINFDLKLEQGAIASINFSFPKDNHVIEGIVVIAAKIYYVIPVQLVKRIINAEEAAQLCISAEEGAKVIKTENGIVSLNLLARSGGETCSDRPIILVLEYESENKAVLVDDLIGLQQVLVTPFTGQLSSCEDYYGCAVLGRGDVGIVVHPRAFFP